jgi:hypothetical protein
MNRRTNVWRASGAIYQKEKKIVAVTFCQPIEVQKNRYQIVVFLPSSSEESVVCAGE